MEGLFEYCAQKGYMIEDISDGSIEKYFISNLLTGRDVYVEKIDGTSSIKKPTTVDSFSRTFYNALTDEEVIRHLAYTLD